MITKTYKTILLRFVNSVYGESNAQNLLQTRKISYDKLAQNYIDEFCKHGARMYDLQSIIHKINENLPDVSERSVIHLENWMRKVIQERYRASK